MKKLFVFILPIVACIIVGAFTNDHTNTVSKASPFIFSKIQLRHKPYSVEIADLNGDKIKDLVIANGEDSSVTILLGTGKGNFKEAKGSPFPPGYMPNDIAIADLNKDGIPDLAFANHDRK